VVSSLAIQLAAPRPLIEHDIRRAANFQLLVFMKTFLRCLPPRFTSHDRILHRRLEDPRLYLELTLQFMPSELKSKLQIIDAEYSGLMYPDTNLGENARHGEVFDEQAKTYIFP